MALVSIKLLVFSFYLYSGNWCESCKIRICWQTKVAAYQTLQWLTKGAAHTHTSTNTAEKMLWLFRSVRYSCVKLRNAPQINCEHFHVCFFGLSVALYAWSNKYEQASHLWFILMRYNRLCRSALKFHASLQKYCAMLCEYHWIGHMDCVGLYEYSRLELR